MNDLIKITDVQPLHGYWLRIRFSDGAVMEVDLDPDVLYGRFEPSSGVLITRRVVSEPAAA
jgi:hypothetical protein